MIVTLTPEDVVRLTTFDEVKLPGLPGGVLVRIGEQSGVTGAVVATTAPAPPKGKAKIPPGKWMPTRYPNTKCRDCAVPLAKGDRIWFQRDGEGKGHAHCVPCGEKREKATPV